MEIREKLHESLIPLSRNRSIRLIVKTFVRREKLINSGGINDKLRGDIGGKSARLNYAALNASRDLGSNFNDSTRDLDDLLRRKGMCREIVSFSSLQRPIGVKKTWSTDFEQVFPSKKFLLSTIMIGGCVAKMETHAISKFLMRPLLSV